MLVLFRSATGEAWQEIMMSCTVGQRCDYYSDDYKEWKTNGTEGSEPPSDCGSQLAIAYFITFYFLSSFLVSLFVQYMHVCQIWISNYNYFLKTMFFYDGTNLSETK